MILIGPFSSKNLGKNFPKAIPNTLFHVISTQRVYIIASLTMHKPCTNPFKGLVGGVIDCDFSFSFFFKKRNLKVFHGQIKRNPRRKKNSIGSGPPMRDEIQQ